jgi:lysophospholipase L1-like esterase
MDLIPAPVRSVSRLAAALLALALLLTGCTSSDRSSATPAGTASGTASSTPRYSRYVALGDSYTAGPFIPTSDLASGCLRSDHNYPTLVARALGITDVRDVSCSGATTGDLVHVQNTFGDARIPPQLDAVHADTDLVTIGIGGNDLGLFGTLVGTCTQLRASDPTGSPCTRRLARTGPDLDTATRTISAHVTTALRRIRARAPRATVVLVGYLRLVPDSGTCRALPLADGDYAQGRRISRILSRSLAQAATRAGARFVDMYAASEGHDICSEDPWVNGSTTDRQKALSYHPFAAGMRADADRVLAALRR